MEASWPPTSDSPDHASRNGQGIGKLPKQDRLRVLIAEPDARCRDYATDLISKHYENSVVLTVDKGSDLVSRVRQFIPNVIIMDMDYPGLDGGAAIRAIQAFAATTPILVWTTHTDVATVRSALASGALGYILKGDAHLPLHVAIELALIERRPLSVAIGELLIEAFTRNHQASPSSRRHMVTKREQEIIRLIAEGLSSKEIGMTLHISTRTVESHRSNCMRKMRVTSTAKMIFEAVRQGIIEV